MIITLVKPNGRIYNSILVAKEFKTEAINENPIRTKIYSFVVKSVFN
jgi:hypothetical protein